MIEAAKTNLTRTIVAAAVAGIPSWEADAAPATAQQFVELLDGCAEFVRHDGKAGAGALTYSKAPRLLCDSCSNGSGAAAHLEANLSAILGLTKSPKTFRNGAANARWGGFDAHCQTKPEGMPTFDDVDSALREWIGRKAEHSGLTVVPRGEAAYPENPVDMFYVCDETGSPYAFYIMSYKNEYGAVPQITFDGKLGAEFCLGGLN